jgi:hypothetical protein
MRMSRLRLYARGVETFFRKHSDEDVTQQMNEAYANNTSKLDPALRATSRDAKIGGMGPGRDLADQFRGTVWL